jgi:predicted aldo/keto reductase-like oxidoreductase
MSTYEQVEDNLKTFKDLKPLSEIEMNAVEEANVHFRKNFAIPCTDCKYCVEHCPANVDIPLNFKAYNEYNKTRDLDDFHRIYNAIPEGRQCTSCIECGVCKSHCPQQIDIPKSLKKVSGIAK